MYQRCSKHYNTLKSNTHVNKHLQNAWNNYGEECFEFNIIEKCENDLLNEKEKYWINYFNSSDNKYGYNIRIDPFTNRGLKWSNEQRKKMYEHINEEGSYYRNHTISKNILEKAWESLRNKIWTEEERKRHSIILTGTKVKDTSNMKKAQTGEGNNYHKLTELEVIEIINLLNNGYGAIELSTIYNISYSNILAIKKNRSWKHLDRQEVLSSENFKQGVQKINEYYKQNKTATNIA